MITAFRGQNFSAAETMIARCMELSNGALPTFYDLYRERIAELRRNPPAAGWDGVFTAAGK
jgi:hypothetical protein